MAEEAPFELTQRDAAEPADATREPKDGEGAEIVTRVDESPRGAAVLEEPARCDAGASQAEVAGPSREEDKAISARLEPARDAGEVAKARTGADAAPAPVASNAGSTGKPQEEEHAHGTLSPQATGALGQDGQTKKDASATQMPSRILKSEHREPWAQAYRRLVKAAVETQPARAAAGPVAGPREPALVGAKLEARSGAGATARNAAFVSGQAGNPAEAALRELLASVNQNHREAMEYRSHQI